MFYLRKIEESQWYGKQLLDSVSVSDLRTADNDISVWQDDGSPGLFLKLALAFTLTTGRISDMWCVNIPDNKLTKYSFHPQPSSTPYLPMQVLHTNIVIPTLYEMGDLAEIIFNLIQNNKQIYVTEQELKECFYNAIAADEVLIDFNDRRYRSFRKPLADIEKTKGNIDFSKLKNAKEVVKRKTCPTCKGQGYIK